jgi:CubicO group peptidase (beta-lactamase class C family)
MEFLFFPNIYIAQQDIKSNIVHFLGENEGNMRNKLIGIFVCTLMITTCVVPVMANTIKNISNEPLNDATFDLKISFLMKFAGYPSLAACIIKDDQIIWSKGYGYYDRSERKPATIDTNYVIASITKTIVGTALMQLYEKGLFNLDGDVNVFLPFDLRNPNFPDDPITFRMLLSHTSSLNDHDTEQYYWMNFSGDPPFDFFPEPYLREYLLPGGRYYDPSVWSTEHRPGEYAMYANCGFDLISYLVEIISGEPFLEYCDTHIFSPLDMKNTGFNFSHLDIDKVAIPYQRVMGRYYSINELYGNESPPDKYWRMRFYPAGGLYTTVSDLSHFLIAHMNNGIYNGTRILEKETVELMHETQPGNRIGYGLAWMHESIRGLSTSGHAGDLPGADTWMEYNQTEDIGVIYFANGNPGFSALQFGGFLPVRLILGSLFTKEGTLRGVMQHEFTLSSEPFFMELLIAPQSKSYEHIYK